MATLGHPDNFILEDQTYRQTAKCTLGFIVQVTLTTLFLKDRQTAKCILGFIGILLELKRVTLKHSDI